MSTTTTNLPKQHADAKPHTSASPRGTRERKQRLHLGTYADGQRASPVTVIYSSGVGSFGDAGRR